MRDAKGINTLLISISRALLIVLVTLAILLVGVRVAGYTPYVVLSGSMFPKYKEGDLVYIKKVDPLTLKKGDVITFVANKDLTLVTHRIVEIDEDRELIYTKGDANADQDLNPVNIGSVVGKVGFSIPYLGYLSTYLTSKVGKYVCISIIFVLLLILLIPEFRNGEKTHERKQKE